MTRDNKPFVYIASPCTKGDAVLNTRFQCEVWDRLLNDGLVWPIAPLWSVVQHQVFPRPYQDWIDFDLACLRLYDACLRLDAVHEPTGYHVSESKGADGEAAAFRAMGKPVFFDIPSLYLWAGRLQGMVDSPPVREAS